MFRAELAFHLRYGVGRPGNKIEQHIAVEYRVGVKVSLQFERIRRQRLPVDRMATSVTHSRIVVAQT